MTAGSMVSALLVAAWSQVRTLEGLYLVMAAIGLTRASVLYDPAFAVIVRWFHQRRGSALLVVTLVAGFASTIALPGSSALIEWLGWRGALLVLAAVLAVVTVVPHWLVLRRDPADLGLHPDGACGPPPVDGVRRPVRAGGLRRTATWAAREPAFRWYAAGFAAQASAVIIVSVHLVPLLREEGHGAAFAAAATGALGALSVSGRLVLTGLARRFSSAGVTAALFALQAAAAVVLVTSGATTVGSVVFVLLFGLGFGAGTIARPALLAQTFGPARYATLAGLMALATTLATTAGAFLAGLVRTAHGSYGPVVAAVGVLCVAGSVCLLRAGAAWSSRAGRGGRST
jgi:predicted MFS family arabinose efflux permease